MGTSDFPDEMGYRDYRHMMACETRKVRRAVFWWRVRTWALVGAIVTVPSALLAWMLWAMR